MENREILGRLYQVVRAYRGRLLIAMVAMAAVSGFSAIQAYMVRPLIDEIFINKDQHLLNLLPLLMVALFLVKGFFYYINAYFLEWVGQSVIRDLRNMVYTHINSLPLSFFQKTATGELISRIINDVSLLQGSVSHAIIYAIRDFFTATGLLVVVFYMDWRLALLSLVFLPMAAVPIVVFGRKFRRISTSYQTRVGEATSILHETIAGVRIVKAFCMERHEIQRFLQKIETIRQVQLGESRIKSLAHPMVENLGGIGIASILWFGGMQVLKGQSTPGTFMSFLTAIIMLYEPVKGVSKINSTIQGGMASAARIFQLLDIAPDIKEDPVAPQLPPFAAHLFLDQVSFSYDGTNMVLKDVSLRIKRGEVVALVGPSGGGKSTLTNLIPRFYDVTEGAITIDGHDIRKVNLHSLRRQIALVTQQTILFNDTVRNNIAYGREDCPEEEIIEAARAAHALDFINSMPDGFDTIIGESGTRLSGGQQQRLSIARAIIKDTPILILDEATSALDTESEREVQRALENLMVNRTTIVIAHRLSTIKNADRIVVVKEGRIVEEGSHEGLLAADGEYAALYRIQYAQ